MTDIIVIGGGAAGMMAAAKAAENGCSVMLLEKNGFCGKKINITGKGRCNMSNARAWNEFSLHIHPSPALLKNAFYNFSNEATIAWFNEAGLETTLEQGQRFFPRSMVARDVSQTMVNRLRELGVEIVFNCDVLGVSKTENGIFRCICTPAGEGLGKTRTVEARAVIVATGGLSYPTTGSTGEGYGFAKGFGIEVTKTLPSLTALKPEHYDPALEGINLENVALNLFIDHDLVQMEQGDVSFTSGGIEGSLGFRVSRKAVKALENGQKVTLCLNLKPAVPLAKLQERVMRELGTKSDGPLKMRALVRKFMPEALVGPFISAHKELTPGNLAATLKEWRFRIISYVGYERAVVTMGGVSQKEIVAKSMEARKVPGLYFAGEVLDIDGDTGGYNLQAAFSTGALAGRSAAQKILKASESSPSAEG